MLVTLQEIIALADEKGFCVPAFNVYNMETVMGVAAAAEEADAPVILQVYPRLIREESGYYVSPVIVAAARAARVPICFHLDHGAAELEVHRALRWGATGIMLDGSALPFDENVALTKRAIAAAGAVGVAVEGEIGHVGTVNDEKMGELTDPQEAAEFVRRTQVCCLAVLIGNAHGHYRKPPKLDIDRVGAIREATGGLPLVLHGGSGIPDEQVRAAIAAGVRKMNVGTDVCCAFADGTAAALADPNRSVAVDLFMRQPIEAVKRLALEKIRLTGAAGMAR